MANWEQALMTRLKTGSIKNIWIYGNNTTRPAPPYVTVRRENSRYLFFTHAALGQAEKIDRYATIELVELLRKPLEIDGGFKQLRVLPESFMPDLAISDDDTISNRISFQYGLLI